MSCTIFNALFPDEAAARAWFEKARWPQGPQCSTCGVIGHSTFLKTRSVWCCNACRHQFSVTAGTPMHRTRLPLLKWAQAISLIMTTSEGISAMKLSEMLAVPYGTAWHIGHRIRAMRAKAHPILAGAVEIAEMYAGAAPCKRAKPDHKDDDVRLPANAKGRGTKHKLMRVAA